MFLRYVLWFSEFHWYVLCLSLRLNFINLGVPLFPLVIWLTDCQSHLTLRRARSFFILYTVYVIFISLTFALILIIFIHLLPLDFVYSCFSKALQCIIKFIYLKSFRSFDIGT